ncbi:PBP1A family penicillin-binding protein [Enterococcus sp. 669A]|uniref:PBP1A family penicillin-binding protein n=1 Tax=Candidatus Enterococcus moelleringii TaxID=2815325 RepID=A0ABS3LD65_9ENTE|nr:PBP1A family penicillin-binding protein [Enterococcus sp. 669A]MBO1306978.1 PBP1A family penicillin-binding protein [Enterococcus sp. 669A]
MAKTSRSEKRPKKAARTKKGKMKRSKQKTGLPIKILTVIVGFLCLVMLAGVGLFFFYVSDAPKLTEKALEAPASSKFFDNSDTEFEDLGAEKRETANADEIPQELDDAIVSIEDRRFFDHNGIDPIRIVGSAIHNLTNDTVQGGSTLTQQLIKLSYFSTDSSDQTLRRKAQEAWLALKLEQQKSKQDILTYYINKVYMANGVYGMKTAAETYYGRPLNELTIAEIALLAGMPQAPSAYDPYQHADAAKKRRNTVLYTMLENNKITQAEYDEASAADVQAGLQPLSTDNEERRISDNYMKEVIAEVERKTGKDVYTDGLEIYTNLDMDAQKQLYDIVNTDMYVQYPDEELQVAATLMDVNTGKVTAQIGGRNIASDVFLGNNLAVSTNRDFGSTVKPITDYGPAIEYDQLSTGTYIQDAPYNYPGTKTPVMNWDNSYYGNITLRQALYDSRNVPAVKLFDQVGADQVSEFLGKLGIKYEDIQLSNAISSNTQTLDNPEYGVSSEKMAAAYSAFANGGTYYEPQYVSRIVYPDGTEETFQSEGEKAMESYTAYMITDILKDVITQGTGTNARIPSLIQAGKTGTSNYTADELAQITTNYGSVSPDVTFTGYTTNYAMSVWTGYNEKLTPITSQSNMIAMDVYRELMEYVSASVPNVDWDFPDDVVRVGNELYVKGATDVPYQQTPSYSYNNGYNNYNNNNGYTVPSATTPDDAEEETTPSAAPDVTTPSAPATEPQQPSDNTPLPDPGTTTPGAGTGGDGGNTGQNQGGATLTPPATQ